MHIVDGSSEQPEYEFDAVRLELEMFSPELAEKPYIVAYNKMDLPEASEKWPSFKEALCARGIEPFCMSAVTRNGTQEVIKSAFDLVQKYKTNKEEGKKPWIQFPLYVLRNAYVAIYLYIYIYHDIIKHSWPVW